jgi:hypothetical protein
MYPSIKDFEIEKTINCLKKFIKLKLKWKLL